MADDLPDAPWNAPGNDLPDAPWDQSSTGLEPEAADHGLSERRKMNQAQIAVSPITSYPETYHRMNREALEQAGHGIDQVTNPQSGWDYPKGIANAVLGGIGYAASPITAAYRSVIGQPIEDITGIPREYPELAAQLATPGLGLARLGGARPPPTTPLRPPPNGPLGVTLSKGQEGSDLPQIRLEQRAARGLEGKGAEAHAQEFLNTQQPAEVAAARETVERGLDPVGGQKLVDTPQEAGEMVSNALQKTAKQAKAAVTSAYDEAKGLPGSVNADAFQGIGNKIKTDLYNSRDPVVIDDKLTPTANAALQEIENNISQLKIPNKADPNLPPDPSQISGVTLEGIDQARKRIKSIIDTADYNNKTDWRAAKRVLQAFDNHVDEAINSGQFSGDPAAIKAWKNARAAHADYKSNFANQGNNDVVGRTVENILGKGRADPLTGNDVADRILSASGVNPNSTNVAVANRVKNVLGEQSPEFAALRQGLFQRLTADSTGNPFGPGKIAGNIEKFLDGDGREMANAMLTKPQRDLFREFAKLHRKLEIPKTGANFSETSTFVGPLLQKISGKIGMGIAALIGATHGVAGVAEGLGAVGAADWLGNAAKARKIKAAMPLIADQMKAYQKAASNATNPASKVRMTAIGANLSRSLSQIGIAPEWTMKTLQGMGTQPVGADQQDQSQ